MSKSIVIGFFIFTFVFVGKISCQQKSENIIQTVDFCELFKNPKDFNEKTVRVTAIYRYGYEWSDIFCLACKDESLMRLELGNGFELNTKREVRKKIKWNPRGKTVKVIAVGKMYANRLGDKRFVVDYFESAKVLLNDSTTEFLNKLPDKVKQREKCLIRTDK